MSDRTMSRPRRRIYQSGHKTPPIRPPINPTQPATKRDKSLWTGTYEWRRRLRLASKRRCEQNDSAWHLHQNITRIGKIWNLCYICCEVYHLATRRTPKNSRLSPIQLGGPAAQSRMRATQVDRHAILKMLNKNIERLAGGFQTSAVRWRSMNPRFIRRGQCSWEQPYVPRGGSNTIWIWCANSTGARTNLP